MKARRVTGLGAGLLASALLLAACSSGGSDGGSTAASGGGDGTGIVSNWNSEPQNPLVPTNTNEVGGAKMIDLIFSGLYYYDEKGAAHPDVAESVTSDDQQTWTVKIKSGQTFSDGSPLTAKNFVDAWNYGAKASNAQLLSYFFESIQGFDAKADSDLVEAGGLTVVDDTTFTVKLVGPESDFPLRLGFTAYYPLPESAFADMAAFGEKPIGNGPYTLASWSHNEGATLRPNPKYDGPRSPKNGGVDLVFYQTLDAAYADVQSGRLDILDQIPDTAFATYESDMPGRTVNQPAALNQTFTIPESLPHFSGEEGQLRRQALSLAIDRETITDKIFSGTRTPAKDFTSPVIDGWNDAISGNEVLNFDAAKAKELWAKADAIAPWDGTFTIAYNADGGHQAWVDAVSNSLKETLGIQAEGKPYPSFKDLRTDVTNRTITGAFRTGWQADYPSAYNFLGAVFGTGAGSNDGDYSNSDFDALLREGLSQSSVEDANKKYDQAQEVLFKDLPAIPLWYQNTVGAWSESVDNVAFGWNSVPLLYSVTKK